MVRTYISLGALIRVLLLWMMAGDMGGRGGEGGRGQGLGLRSLHDIIDRLGYLLSPPWPVWSEALGFMGWSKEDSPGRNGWLHTAAADI